MTAHQMERGKKGSVMITHSLVFLPRETGSEYSALTLGSIAILASRIQADLREMAVLVPDHHSQVNIAIERVTRIFWFPRAYKHYVYTLL